MLRSNIPVEMLRLQKEEVDSVFWLSREEIERLCNEGKFNKIHYQLLLDCEERLTSLHLKTEKRNGSALNEAKRVNTKN